MLGGYGREESVMSDLMMGTRLHCMRQKFSGPTVYLTQEGGKNASTILILNSLKGFCPKSNGRQIPKLVGRKSKKRKDRIIREEKNHSIQFRK